MAPRRNGAPRNVQKEEEESGVGMTRRGKLKKLAIRKTRRKRGGKKKSEPEKRRRGGGEKRRRRKKSDEGKRKQPQMRLLQPNLQLQLLQLHPLQQLKMTQQLLNRLLLIFSLTPFLRPYYIHGPLVL